MFECRRKGRERAHRSLYHHGNRGRHLRVLPLLPPPLRVVGGAGGIREVINAAVVMRGGRDGRQRPPGPVVRTGPGINTSHPDLSLLVRPHGLWEFLRLSGKNNKRYEMRVCVCVGDAVVTLVASWG